MPGIEIDRRQDRWRVTLNLRQLRHSSNGVENKNTAATKNANVIVQRIFPFVTEANFFGPMEFVCALIVTRRCGPAYYLDRGVALFFSLLVGSLRPVSDLLEKLIIIDLLRIFIFHVAVFLIGNNYTPKRPAKRRDICRQQHSKGLA